MKPVSQARLEAAEARLRWRFPDGYRAFMTQHGEASFSTELRVYGPESVVEQNEHWRLGVGDYFFWPHPESALDRARTPECVRLVDTLNGDVLAVHPEIPSAYFLFPRHDDRIHRFDGTFDEALEWLLASNICLHRTRSRYVEPLHVAPGYEAWLIEDPALDALRHAGLGDDEDVDDIDEEPDEATLALLDRLEARAHARMVERIAALDHRSMTLLDLVCDEHRADVFLPSYEARVRLDAPDAFSEPTLTLASYLDRGPSLEDLRRALATLEIVLTDAPGSRP